MPQLPAILTFAGTLAWKWKYPLVFLGVAVEGPILMIACGFLLRLGVFSLAPLYLAAVLGDLAADCAWYYVGYRFAEPMLAKRGHFLGVSSESFSRVKALMHRYQTPILLASKVTLGFGLALATVIAAGATRVPFRRYLVLNAIGEVVLVALMLAIGFFFGHLYTLIDAGFRDAFVVGGILVAALAVYGFSRYVRRRTLAE